MKAQIIRNIQYSQGQRIISEATVKKKSAWLGIWRTYLVCNIDAKSFYFQTKFASFGAIRPQKTQAYKFSYRISRS